MYECSNEEEHARQIVSALRVIQRRYFCCCTCPYLDPCIVTVVARSIAVSESHTPVATSARVSGPDMLRRPSSKCGMLTTSECDYRAQLPRHHAADQTETPRLAPLFIQIRYVQYERTNNKEQYTDGAPGRQNKRKREKDNYNTGTYVDVCTGEPQGSGP